MSKRSRPAAKPGLLEVVIDGIREVKGHDIVSLDLRAIPHAITDYFVVCHGNSHTQVDAISRSVERETEKRLNESPWHKEGLRGAEWVLLDYSDIVVHIFHRDARPFYGLEDLWADAKANRYEDKKENSENVLADV